MQINNVSMQNFGLIVTDRAAKFLTKSNSLGDALELSRIKNLYSDNIKLDIREPLPSTQKKFRFRKPVILSLQWQEDVPVFYRTYSHKLINIEDYLRAFLKITKNKPTE